LTDSTRKLVLRDSITFDNQYLLERMPAEQQWLIREIEDLPAEDEALRAPGTEERARLERLRRLAAGKFVKMNLTAYNYFRGTNVVFLNDMTQPGALNYPTEFSTADAALVLLVGDPHPENIGSFRTGDDRMVIDFNDFDAATYGPFHLDVRRLALGFWMMGYQINLDRGSDVFTDADLLELATRVARAYVDEMERIGSGTDRYTVQIERSAFTAASIESPVFADRFDSGISDGDVQEELDEYTELDDSGARIIKPNQLDPPDFDDPELGVTVVRDETFAVDTQTKELLEDLIKQLPDTLHAGGDEGRPTNPLYQNQDAVRIKGVSRRLGAGVTSYPIRRYYVLVEGETSSTDDDVLLEFKEILDAPQLPGLLATGYKSFETNAQRVVRLQRELQTFPDDDVWLGYVEAGAFSMRVRHRTKYQKGVGVDDLGSDFSRDDVFQLATDAGRLLAATHDRTRTLTGKDSGEVVRAAIGVRGDAFVAETTAVIEEYGPITRDDYRRYGELLDELGPTLGYRFAFNPDR